MMRERDASALVLELRPSSVPSDVVGIRSDSWKVRTHGDPMDNASLKAFRLFVKLLDVATPASSHEMNPHEEVARKDIDWLYLAWHTLHMFAK